MATKGEHVCVQRYLKWLMLFSPCVMWRVGGEHTFVEACICVWGKTSAVPDAEFLLCAVSPSVLMVMKCETSNINPECHFPEGHRLRKTHPSTQSRCSMLPTSPSAGNSVVWQWLLNSLFPGCLSHSAGVWWSAALSIQFKSTWLQARFHWWKFLYSQAHCTSLLLILPWRPTSKGSSDAKPGWAVTSGLPQGWLSLRK